MREITNHESSNLFYHLAIFIILVPGTRYIPYARYDDLYHTPLDQFSMVDISRNGTVPVPKRSTLETSRRELYDNASFGIGTLLVVEQSKSSLDYRPRGGMIIIMPAIVRS